VPDVPVIYFVEPTEENIARIVADYRAGLYSYMHVNFASGVSSGLLKRFAGEISQQPSAKCQISRVIDRFASFVSLDQSTFSLNLNSTYLNLHKASVSDKDIEEAIERVAQGLMSVLVTCMKQVPVIRASQNGAAGMAAKLLNDRLVEHLKSTSDNIFFSSSASVSADPSHAQRPLLVILDRDSDLTPMVQHGWSYAGLMTDLLGMNLNKVSLPKEQKVYDIDVSEDFWKKIAHLAFPEAATKVNELVSEFGRIRTELTTQENGNMSSAMTALPRVTDMKKTVDMHTSIATTLLNEIKARNLDKFVEIENTNSLTGLISILSDPTFSHEDKIRTAIYLCLKKEGAKIDQIIAQLGPSDSSNALRYVKSLLSLRQMTSSSAGSATPPSSMLEGLTERMKSGIKNLKTMLPENENLLLTSTVQQLADQIVNPLTESFHYFDPRNPGSNVRVRGNFRQIIVCVVGGGSISESENFCAWAAKTGRTLVYGASDFPHPSQFLADLAKLAK